MQMATLTKSLGYLFYIIVITTHANSQPLFPATDTNMLKYYPNLTVFIGSMVEGQDIKRDSFTKWSPDQYRYVDAVINVKYKVHQWVYGEEKPPDTLTLTSYDFSGEFEFLDYDFVMLYVYKEEDKTTYQHWYRHNKLFPTKNGRWAGPPPRDWFYEDSVEKSKLNLRVMPYEDMARIKLFVYPDSIYYEDELEPLIKWCFPPDIFKMVGFEMVTDLGNYETEIFEYEKNDLIKYAIFKENNYNFNDLMDAEPIVVKRRYKKEKSLLSKKESYALVKFHYDFLDAIKTRDTVNLKQWISSEISVCDSVYSQAKFLEICFPTIAERIDSHYVYKYASKKPWSVLKDKYGPYAFYQLNVQSVNEFEQVENKYRKGVSYKDKIYITYPVRDQEPFQKILYFIYVLRKGKFYLYGVDYEQMRDCCR